MEFVPEDGDITIHYYWPSGSKLELQIYFKKGEHIKSALDRLFESEGITYAIFPDIMRIVSDIFLYERRNPLASLSSPGVFPKSGNDQENHHWKSYSQLFESASSLSSLLLREKELAKCLKDSSDKRTKLLIHEENRYAHELAGIGQDEHKEIDSVHKEAVDAIENEFLRTQASLKEEFWKYVEIAELSKNTPSDPILQLEIPNSKPFSHEITVSIGAQAKRKFILGVAESDDICDIPIIPIKNNSYFENPLSQESESASDIEESSTHISHPGNVYKRYISALVLPYSYQDSLIHIVPELIRCSEEKPELHFAPIRYQINNAESSSNGEQIIFTKHSNIKGIEGAFHIPENRITMVKDVIIYANLQGAKHLIIPIPEWTETEANKNPVELVKIIKTGMIESGGGDLEIVSFTIESDDDAMRNVLLKNIQEVFAESIIRVD
ncbi:unnamed protein product [Blepharisma stoltei]|uniref:Uncharacterized protein n=1 Tax=Blepharisma stoltei TaxID=1481888 RepID=A0AAU9J5T6_9CILI|nr:unnamed protein product [Blepharisma stoltei]